MLAQKSVIRWDKTTGKISVIPRNTGDDKGDFQSFLKPPKENTTDTARRILSEFVTIIVRDGLDPQDVHKEFVKIDEYAWSLSVDTPGSR